MKIYTKTGDAGETALFGGRRVPKNDLRVDAYGTVDELNAFIGQLRDGLERGHPLRPELLDIQSRLFTVGAHLATDPAKRAPIPGILPSDIEILEKAIDQMDGALPPLQNFVLPGGHPLVSATHVCRTVCRRAERLAVALHQVEPLDGAILRYLNRLSDYFFILSRHLAQILGATEVLWKGREDK